MTTTENTLLWPPEPGQVNRITPHVERVLAPNASSMTFEGTNSYVLAAGDRSIVIDPGTDDADHLAVLARTATEDGRSPAGVLLTHDHPDHSDGARSLSETLQTPILAMSPRFADVVIADEQQLPFDGLEVQVLHTPGHSEDSVCLWLPAERTLLTGDTVLGARTATIMGDLGDLFRSLDRLTDLVADADLLGLPGHGREFTGFAESIQRIISVRRRRIGEIRAIVLDGDTTVEKITRRLYPDATGTRAAFAMTTVFSTLDYLLAQPAEEGIPDETLHAAASADIDEMRRNLWSRSRRAEKA